MMKREVSSKLYQLGFSKKAEGCPRVSSADYCGNGKEKNLVKGIKMISLQRRCKIFTEAGIMIEPSPQVALKLGVKYFNSFESTDLNGQSNLGINVGLVFLR